MTDLAAAETTPSGTPANPFAGRPLLADRRAELTATTLTAAERQLIAEQLTLVLEDVLVHRHQKKALYGVDVAPRLALLRRGAAGMSDAAFHDEVCDIVNALRDGHTDYTAPGPRNAASVVLRPFFMVERCWIPGQDRWAWLATHLQGVGPEDTLTEGAELTHWNGVPIDVAIARNAEREWGNNPAARTTRGAASMAGRRLRNGPLPDEDWVDIRFVIDEQPGETRLPWVVLGPQPAPAPATPSAAASPGTVLGVEERQRELHELTSRLVAPARRSARRSDDGQVVAEPVPSTLDKKLAEAWAVTTPTGTFGHLRIYSFMPGRGPSDANAAMYADLVRLLDDLPREGLVIDVRGNGGGSIFVVEMLLQHLTPRRIEGTPFQLAVSEETATLVSADPRATFLAPFGASLAQGLRTGAQYSATLPFFSQAAVNYFGQTYFGPVVLVTDARCFSATDIFAAAFESHGIGPILGVDENTGAGGANVLSHDQLRGSLPGVGLRPLPTGTGLTVAVGRALRIGERAGQPLEDLGVTPTALHKITRRDLLESNADLLTTAGRMLAAQEGVRGRLDAATSTDNGSTVLTLTCDNLDSVDVYVDGRPVATAAAAPTTTVTLGAVDLATAHVRVEGFRGTALAAARTLNPPVEPGSLS